VSIFVCMKILMVCLGNICRSPLAEGIMREKIRSAGLNWLVDSAGTAGYHVGEAPHRLSQKVALHNGIDISTQACRQFMTADFADFDRIYVMDLDNYENVKRIGGKAWKEDKVSLMLDSLYPSQQKEVPDPWYGTEKDYHLVYDLLDRACDRIILAYQQAAAKKES
jgi:protein-tyrosine phosphatase